MLRPRTLCLLALALAGTAQAQPTAFTYQGELSNGGTPVEGLCDVRFRLYDAVSGVGQVGAAICADNVQVSQGRFAVLVDFGPQFNGQPRFIEVDVRLDTGLDCSTPGGFTTLAPRQAVTPTPEALYARDSTRFAGQSPSFYTTAGNLSGTLPSGVLSGSYLNTVNISNPANVFAGSGVGLTNLNAAAITSGTVPETRLPANLPRLSANNAFTAATNTFAGNVGVGIAAPAFKLDVRGGPAYFENTGNQAELLWLASERSWVFRQQGTGAETALMLESVGGGGNKHLLIKTDGFVGIGTTSPTAKLDVNGDLEAFAVRTSSLEVGSVTASSVSSSFLIAEANNPVSPTIQGRNTNTGNGGVGVLGATTSSGAFTQNMIGVHGSTASTGPNSFGVFSTGRFGATGTKSFRIDHPEDPEHRYLFHYSAESPEVINFYRGTVTLDPQGSAIVTLPSYFALVNTRPSYQLTAVGAPMPMLHVSQRISDEALRTGETPAAGAATPVCTFVISGGAPGGDVCWRVEAARNDEFVRKNGAPVEIEKTDNTPSTIKAEQPQPPNSESHD